MGMFTVATLKKVWLLLCVLVIVIGAALCLQYFFFRDQVEDLQVLQDHYKDHIEVLKQVLADVLLFSEEKTVSQGVQKKPKHKKQLYRSLRSYLAQKDRHVDIYDLQEVYRSFESDDEPKVETVRVNTVRPRIAARRKTARTRIFNWPIERDRFWMSSFFGRRKIARGKWTFHSGLDMAAIKGTPIRAAADGRVLEAGDSNNGYGNMILLAHANGFKTRYAHLDHVGVRYGHTVKRGQIIGTVGDTGNVRGNGTDASHLHFEVYHYAKPVNPLYYLT
jgi:murein DD-endopeptidase MepM/ murein hydrolase activator NlpD